MFTPYIVGIVMSVAAFIADYAGCSPAAGLILIAEAAVLGIYFYWKDRCLVSFRLLLSVFWIGGEGLAAFRLSHLHPQWTGITWLCFSLFYLVFLLGYDLAEHMGIQKLKMPRWCRKLAKRVKTVQSREVFAERVFHCILIMTAIPLAAFVFEAAVLGYIPLFSEETHAYDHFHITGVHYFTVSAVFVPALSTIWLLDWGWEHRNRKYLSILTVCNVIAIMIPVMCISKFQFALAVMLPVILFLLMRSQIPVKYLITGFAVLFVVLGGAAVVMTLSRHYEPGYLNSIFEMRDESMPVMFQYVYMYIANNYANFNELTMAIGSGNLEFAWGMKELFPVFALTGMKFVFPELVNYPAPVTKDTLNTLTIIYDAYYDFGVAGVVVFAAVLGIVCAKLRKMTKKRGNPISYLFYGQIAMYVMLSFFSAWFTVPTTWFWLVLTGMMYIYTSVSGTGGLKTK